MSEIKLCKDCKHYTKIYGFDESYCGAGEIEPVHGFPSEYCRQARTINGSCGIKAKNFEQKPEPVQPEVPEGYKVAGETEYGVLLEPIDTPLPWWKFWGKA